MTTTASPFLGRWCVTLRQSDVAVRVPARILAERLLESGRLGDELRRFALAREGARHEVRIAQSTTGQLPADTAVRRVRKAGSRVRRGHRGVSRWPGEGPGATGFAELIAQRHPPLVGGELRPPPPAWAMRC
ncbi:hypothetical protein FNV64_53145 [Streptomyces sp. S1A1-7]|uniref:hypothetical protein n=1 Tax=Streptomyces sp. S1A1-7 TaxID=2594459 RepID=UPI001162181A|nr:hypothetical protein [Streptomyces sp. S1A1-7]QDN83061.1 hypothetical protein FNV64_53145 [Streptomyces sp. S1A1-7]